MFPSDLPVQLLCRGSMRWVRLIWQLEMRVASRVAEIQDTTTVEEDLNLRDETAEDVTAAHLSGHDAPNGKPILN